MQKKILVVDDETKILEMITDYLESLGYITLTASDGLNRMCRSSS